jgi:outer membrane murein-binding lipoprotein Lpp
VVLSTAIDNLSSQMVNSSKEQQLSLNAQITKLTELVTAMQENVRASENIANVLA